MIEVTHASKRFGRRPAVEDVSLAVPRGEIFGLLGPNGAGKTTLLRLLAGRVGPSAGEPRIGGHDVFRARRAALARVGAIFESPAFYDELSGWRNLQIFTGYTAAVPPARLREVIEWVGLSGRECSAVKTYSHGMRARLALAQALLPDPELLILDEPADGLDPEGIHELRGTILRLHRELGLTILLSSHLLAEVEQLCTRIAVLRQGRLVFTGRLEEARQPRREVRLSTPDFPGAVAGLTAADLVRESSSVGTVRLADAAAVDDLARWLVAHGHRVDALAPHEETLEEFYLRLMGAEER
ncbi:MAG TPA: ABC transporter ATP-binding protein [Verrucomicrobiota bacterium]|nr:ABC transporter ATP-binding protein [Verrucomicrobiota bacterium]